MQPCIQDAVTFSWDETGPLANISRWGMIPRTAMGRMTVNLKIASSSLHPLAFILSLTSWKIPEKEKQFYQFSAAHVSKNESFEYCARIISDVCFTQIKILQFSSY